jgi:hypothetical protein
MQFAALAVAVLALGLAAYALRRSRIAQHDLDAFALWFINRYEIEDEQEFDLVEADIGHLIEN